MTEHTRTGTVTADLVDIRRRINEEHEAQIDLQRGMIERAIGIGGLLAEAKALVKHGEWKSWVEENCPFARMQASRYLKAHANRDGLRQMMRQAHHLSLDDGLRMLRGLPPRSPSEGSTTAGNGHAGDWTIIFDYESAWERVKSFLLTQFESWPDDYKVLFRERLDSFCMRIEADRSDAGLTDNQETDDGDD